MDEAIVSLTDSTGLPSAQLGLASDARAAATNVSEEELFELVVRSLRRIIGRHDPNFDDLLQSAFESVWKALPSFEGRSSLSTWVFRVSYRSVLTQRRFFNRILSRFQFGSDYENDPAVEEGADEELLQRVRAGRLHAALGRMKPAHAAIVVMVELEGMSLQEVAELLELPPMTVRSRLRRARLDLSSRLKKDRFFGASACTNGRETREQGSEK